MASQKGAPNVNTMRKSYSNFENRGGAANCGDRPRTSRLALRTSSIELTQQSQPADPIEESLKLRRSKGGYCTYVVKQHQLNQQAQPPSQPPVPFCLRLKSVGMVDSINLFDSKFKISIASS